MWKSFRTSTGSNFDEAQKNFKNTVVNDKKYRELSKKAYEAEKKRLLMEKPAGDDEEKYEKIINSKEYLEADKQSQLATAAKDKRVRELAKDYVDTIKTAKLKDMNIPEEEMKHAKEFVSDKFNKSVWDENLEYNPDNYYESWVDEEKFK